MESPDFPGDASGKESAANAGDLGVEASIPGSGRSPGVENDNPLQSSCLENCMDKQPGGLRFMGLQRVRHSQVTEDTYEVVGL